jgi:hypothetical protein
VANVVEQAFQDGLVEICGQMRLPEIKTLIQPFSAPPRCQRADHTDGKADLFPTTEHNSTTAQSIINQQRQA